MKFVIAAIIFLFCNPIHAGKYEDAIESYDGLGLMIRTEGKKDWTCQFIIRNAPDGKTNVYVVLTNEKGLNSPTHINVPQEASAICIDFDAKGMPTIIQNHTNYKLFIRFKGEALGLFQVKDAWINTTAPVEVSPKDVNLVQVEEDVWKVVQD